jgi:hypothetical protein
MLAPIYHPPYGPLCFFMRPYRTRCRLLLNVQALKRLPIFHRPYWGAMPISRRLNNPIPKTASAPP